MKKHILKYFAALFFIAIFFFKGVVTVMPVLFSDYNSSLFITSLMNDETENNKNNTEERFDTETKEFYLHNNYLVSVNLPGALTDTKNIGENNIAFKQHFYASIPTPPPELV